MKTLKVFVFISITFLSGCLTSSHISQTSGLSQEDLSMIPNHAEGIIVRTSKPLDLAFEEVHDILVGRGHRLERVDKERGYLSTSGKDLGNSTLQRMVIVLSESDQAGFTSIRFDTEMMPGAEATSMASTVSVYGAQSNWMKAYWNVSRLGIAFAESVAIAKQIENGDISYL